ncbi:hypothetical protein EDI_314460 [Entamoeba dispar SAW760]|uniref:Uncharacterized protein n=1 Tax=Entamoeba dispar (strain ATCC PRA-260 / SAW760) TaxID=370354 RepID=B0E834_ENTDS|nr:uncharacterized protein EDI_314460 [Entamoeba dispar SAW760]EDR29313.1 hypothetical protein EDI_314460 [Entamoeba dispar SAW760]|eukprot:EDR29313.1 hypothetical protein EDI_314460 [Entamoeba dispar SAW760]
MAKAGLIARHADSDDGRATRLYLTDEGHAALKPVRRVLRRRTRCRRAMAACAAGAVSGGALSSTIPHRRRRSTAPSKAIPIRIFDSIFMPSRRHFLRVRRPLPATLSGYALLQKTACRAAFESPTLQSTSTHSSPARARLPVRPTSQSRPTINENEKES